MTISQRAIRFLRIFFAYSSVLVFLAACSNAAEEASQITTNDGNPTTQSQPSLKSLTLTPTAPILAKGLTKIFTATGTYTDGSTQDLTAVAVWSTSSLAVANISTTGFATAVGIGTAMIGATVNGIAGETPLIVTEAALTEIKVTAATTALPKGLTQQFTATGTYSDGSSQDITASVSWGSAATTVANIASNGIATALGVGVTLLSAKQNGITGTFQFTVNPAELIGVSITPLTLVLDKGTTQQFIATGKYTDSSTQDFTTGATWSTSLTSVAIVSAVGLVTAVGVGTSSISATVSGLVGTTTLNVTSAALKGISITPSAPSLAKGLTQQFTATGSYSDGTTQNLTTTAVWSSQSTAVATVNAGLATATGTGTSTLTATVGSITSSTTITVTPAVLQSISVTPNAPSIAKGLTQQFTATGNYSDGTKQNFTTTATWSSQSTAVATVSAGLATATGIGTASITAAVSGITGSTTLTVTAAALKSIGVAPALLSMAKGLTQIFTATGTYTDGSTQDLTTSAVWNSSVTTVAAVTTGSTIKALDVGTSMISASTGGATGTVTLTVTPAVLQSLSITPSIPSIAKGLTQQFTAVGIYSDASTQNLTASATWTSQTTTVATINSTGLASAVGMGVSTISAGVSGISSSTTLSVTPAKLQSLNITPSIPSIAKGLTQQFTAVGIYSDASTQNLTASATWTSQTTTVATINSTGLASTVGEGVSTISAVVSGISSSTMLSVTPVVLQSISITPATPSVLQGLSQQFAATGNYSDGSSKNLTASATWTSQTISVATIRATGLATTVGAGTTQISAAVSGISSSATLTVVKAYSIGGTVSNLIGNGLSLSLSSSTNTSTEILAISANGPFTFATPVASGSTYTLTIKTFPTDQDCQFANSTKTITGSVSNNAVNEALSCYARVRKLNDTGITADQCYQAESDVLVPCSIAGATTLNPAQDGMVGRDANVATNDNTDGKLGFSFSSVAGGCVQDYITGLMWEVKTAGGGLRDWNKTYTHYDSTTAAQKSDGTAPTQAEIDAATNSIGFKNAVNSQALCGFSDWRLPTPDELRSIVDAGVVVQPAVDATWFPNTRGNSYWSTSPSAGLTTEAWAVGFNIGYDLKSGRSTTAYSGYVRLVRGGQSPTLPRYTLSTDGQEVTDNQTNLIWRRCSEGMVLSGSTCLGTPTPFTQEGALLLAASQASSTSIAWRLPNFKELGSIADKSLFNPAIDATAFPATPSYYFWSATPFAGNSFIGWYVHFYDGNVFINNRDNTYYVRLVRSGQ